MKNQINNKFSFENSVFLTQSESESNDESNDLKQFKGIAYSGGIIKRRGYFNEAINDYEDLIFDCNSIEKPEQLSVLYEHEADSPCDIVGLATQFEFSNKVEISGYIFNSETGKEIREISRQAESVNAKYPWQLSFFIESSRIDRIAIGDSVNCNGRTFNGPLTIYRDNVLREVSFTTTAADKNTSATLFKYQQNNIKSEDKTNMSDFKELYENAIKDVESLKLENQKFKNENQILQNHINEVKSNLEALNTKFKSVNDELQSSREQSVKHVFKSIGQELEDAELKFYASMPTNDFDVIANRFTSLKTSLAEKPKHSDDEIQFNPKFNQKLEKSFATTDNETKPQAEVNPLAKFWGDK